MNDSEAPRILIADNDEGVVGMMRLFLEQKGLGVEVAGDGVEALEKLRNGGLSLLICDLDMPRMSGEELLAELRDWQDPPPVLVVSGFIDGRLEQSLGAHPAVRALVRKPFDMLEFSARADALAREERVVEPPAGGGLFDPD